MCVIYIYTYTYIHTLHYINININIYIYITLHYITLHYIHYTHYIHYIHYIQTHTHTALALYIYICINTYMRLSLGHEKTIVRVMRISWGYTWHISSDISPVNLGRYQEEHMGEL